MESSKVYEAIKANDVEALEALLADPDTDTALRDSEGRGFLHHAVLTGADPLVLKALVGRLDIAARDNDGKTVMDLILSSENPDALREVVEEKVKGLLLDGGEEGTKEAERLLLAGWSHWPLTAEEAEEKSEEVAQLLARMTELKDKAAKVHLAVQEGRLEDLKELLDDKLLAAVADCMGLPPLHKAVIYQQGEVAQWLVTEFPDILNITDNMGRTALHYAAVLTDEGTLYNTLKEAGADETITDSVGKAPTDYQQQPDALPIADILQKLEAAAKAGETVEEAPPEEPKTPTPPPEPEMVVPVMMYIPSHLGEQRAPPPTSVDGKYVAQHLGTALTLALAEIVEKRPWDPIEYLGQWLYKYQKNLDEVAKKERLLAEIRLEEELANIEAERKFRRKQEQLRMEEERRRKAEEEREARRREQEEAERRAKEASLSQAPQLPTVTEEEFQDVMFRERDENGQTELHILAAQSGADLVALINLGYSLADRDANNKTARDIAEEQELTQNVEAIDNYVSNLLEQENLEVLNHLILDGYDKLDAVLAQVSTEGLPEKVTDFVLAIPQLQERVRRVFRAVSTGVLREVENALERRNLALAKDVYGRSPLHMAILAGHNEIAQHIIQNFPLSLKTRDNLNRTPLHYAAALSEELTEFLKENGADADAKDAKQHTPNYYKDENEEIVALKETLPPPAPVESEGPSNADAAEGGEDGENQPAVPEAGADNDNQPEDEKVKEPEVSEEKPLDD